MGLVGAANIFTEMFVSLPLEGLSVSGNYDYIETKAIITEQDIKNLGK